MGGYRPTAARRAALAPALCALAALCSAGPRAADAAAPEAPFFPSKLAIVKDAVGPVRGRKVADVGCGTGELTREMAVESGAEHVWCIDNAAHVMKRTVDNSLEGNLVTYATTGAENMPIAADAADVVLFINTLHHVRKKFIKRALRETTRALKPEGHVVIVEPVLPEEGSAHRRLLERSHDESKELKVAEAELRKFCDAPKGLFIESESFARTEKEFANYEAWAVSIITADRSRKHTVESREDELRALFLEAARFRSTAAVTKAKKEAAAAAKMAEIPAEDTTGELFDEFGVRLPISDEEMDAADAEAEAAENAAATLDDLLAEDEGEAATGVYVLEYTSKVFVLRQEPNPDTEAEWWTVIDRTVPTDPRDL